MADAERAMAEVGKKARVLPSIKPERDEVASYRRSARAEPPRPSSFNGLMAVVILVMGLMMAVGGVALYEVQQKLDHANRLLEQGQANVSDLESRVVSTGTDVSKTLRDLKGQVQTNFTEIDKLWAVAYRQNKPEIQQNAQAIERLQLDLEGKLAAIDSAVKSINQQTAASLQKMQAVRDGQMNDSEELITQLALLRTQVQEQATVMEAVRRQTRGMDARMQEVRADIEAINGFRASFNERLLNLER